ncbi:MAG: glycosyltransferase [Patescibacteria group bacterium]|nr:glycosyltransferase [Patescibacteria group bacterium]
MKIAICYDWANRIGGAERVLSAIADLWPKADLFTTIYFPKEAPWAKNFASIKTSFLQKIPLIKKNYRLFYPLMSLAFEQFNFDGYDLAVSVSSGPAKAIVTKPETKHVCYCLTPPRYLWQKRFLKSKRLFPRLESLRKSDFVFAQRPDLILAISKNVQKRIRRFYQRPSRVVYPGIDLNKFKPSSTTPKDYFLIVSRLVSYKKIDLAISAFNQTDKKLKIIGDGPEKEFLIRMAKSNIEFLGQVEDSKLIDYYQNCQALIMPQEEDLGLTAIEAQACGRPVIAYGRGGALETIIPNETGLFLKSQTAESLKQAIAEFQTRKFKPENCVNNAKKFSEKEFVGNFKRAVCQATK